MTSKRAPENDGANLRSLMDTLNPLDLAIKVGEVIRVLLHSKDLVLMLRL